MIRGNLVVITAVCLCFGLQARVDAGGQTEDSQGQAHNNQDNSLSRKDKKFLRSNVIYNENVPAENAPTYRLSRTKPAGAPTTGPSEYQTPTADLEPTLSKEQKPVAEKEEAQKLLRESFDSTINACNHVIVTAVLAGQMSVPEELHVRGELDKLKALNKSYAAKGYTAATFKEMQLKFVNLQLLIYQYGTNTQTR